MNDAELGEYLKSAQNELEDSEDELSIILERSNSGHISGKYIQSNVARIEQKIDSLKTMLKEINMEITNRKI
jgi:hypothetical protein